MLAVRTPGAPLTARVAAACGSAFPFERQGGLLRSRSISGLFSRSLHSGLHRPDVSAALTTVAFDQSGPRWLGISNLIAEPEGPTFISYKVARSRLDRLRFVTQDPQRTLATCRNTRSRG